MSNTWFIGDLHFGHAKVADIRGFESTSAHDIHLYEMWKRQVGQNDVVYVMGDISSGSTTGELLALGFLQSLPGRKRLISGNHDSVSSIHRGISPHLGHFWSIFESINDFGRIRLEKENILLSHYPYASQGDGPGREHRDGRHLQYRLPDLGERLIHAHTHHNDPTSGSKTEREFCVSWDAWGRLVDLHDVETWLKNS